MSWSKSVTVGSVSGDMAAPVSDLVGVADTATAVLTTGGGATTEAVYPGGFTPLAVWSRSGNWLTSSGRFPVPVFDEEAGFTLGVTEPTWANTAITSTAGLTTFVGTAGNKHELVSTSDGQVIENMYLPDSRIRIAHANVTVRNCLIRTGYDGSRVYIQNNVGVVTDSSSRDVTGWVLDRVTVDSLNAGSGGAADGPDVSGFFLVGRGVAYRCAARYVTDAFMPDQPPGSPLTPRGASHFWGCYSENRWLSYDPQQSDGTHNDGVQLTGQDGDTIIGSTLRNPTGGVVDPGSGMTIRGQCIVISPYHGMTPPTVGGKDAGQVSNTVIYRNWLYGAFTQLASWVPLYEGGPGSPGLTIVGNRHGGKCEWPILITPVTSDLLRAASGNVVVPGGMTWNGGALSGGSTINPRVSASSTLAGQAGSTERAFAGNDQQVEPGQVCYMTGKGKTTGNAWVNTGAWSQVSGPAVTITSGTSSDGFTRAWFTCPVSASAQTVVMRFAPTGLGVSDTITVTIPPNQT